MMTLEEATEQACKAPTLLDALAWIAVWEAKRGIRDAIEHVMWGAPKNEDDPSWHSCFRACFKGVLAKYDVEAEDGG